NVFDVKVQGNYAYAIERTNGYLDVIDIRNPAAPLAVGELQVFGGPYALAVQGRYAYIANAASFKVIDVANPAAPTQVSTTAETDVEGIYVQGRYAYLAEKTNLQVLVY